MSEINHSPSRVSAARKAQAGAFAVEFALVVVIFLTLVFGVMEISRTIYLINTLQEVSRRAASAAANINFQDAAAKNEVRQNAIFRTSPGGLLLGMPVTDQHLRIDYLALLRATNGSMTLTPMAAGSMPASPAENRRVCLRNPNDPCCIRFVRVRICDPGDTNSCVPVRYQTLLPLIDLPFRLPLSTTIATADTLGYVAGSGT